MRFICSFSGERKEEFKVYFVLKQTHRHREHICNFQKGCRGREGLGVCDQQMQTITYKMDKKNKVLLHSTGVYSQEPLTNHNGKEYKEEHMCVCVYI